jgi:hypothetical protein
VLACACFTWTSWLGVYLCLYFGQNLGPQGVTRRLHERLRDLVPLSIHLLGGVYIHPQEMLIHSKQIYHQMGFVYKNIGTSWNFQNILCFKIAVCKPEMLQRQ